MPGKIPSGALDEMYFLSNKNATHMAVMMVNELKRNTLKALAMLIPSGIRRKIHAKKAINNYKKYSQCTYNDQTKCKTFNKRRNCKSR